MLRAHTGSHGNELPPCLIHPTHHVSEQPPPSEALPAVLAPTRGAAGEVPQPQGQTQTEPPALHTDSDLLLHHKTHFHDKGAISIKSTSSRLESCWGCTRETDPISKEPCLLSPRCCPHFSSGLSGGTEHLGRPRGAPTRGVKPCQYPGVS